MDETIFSSIYYLILFKLLILSVNTELPEPSKPPVIATVTIKDSPYNVQILIGTTENLNEATYCPGTIIGTKWIITSSSCGVEDPSLMTVFVGSDELFTGMRYEVERMFTMERDRYIRTVHTYPMMMIVQLKLDLEMGIGVMAVKLGGRSEENIFDGNIGNLTGFGDMMRDPHSFIQKSLLHRVEVPIYRHQTCIASYLGHAFPRTTDICVYFAEPKWEANSTCIGERGIPLVMNFKLVGIASSIRHCGSYIAPTLFVSIPASRDWICNITGL